MVGHSGSKVLSFVFLLLLLLTTGPGLLGAAANNLASQALLGEWNVVNPLQGLPQCGVTSIRSRARPYLEWTLSMVPTSQQALVNAGRVAWLAGDCSAAEATWRQALMAAPDDPMAAFWLFWAAGAADSPSPRALSAEALARYAYLAGEQARRADLPDQAAVWYELSLAVAPRRDTANRLAAYHSAAGRLAEALAVWQQMADALPEADAEHWWAVGRAAEMARDWWTAARAYARGAELAESAYDFRMAEGDALRRAQNWESAEAVYYYVIFERPQNWAPYLGLGNVFYARQNYRTACNWYELAVLLSPRNADAVYYLSQALYQVGEVEEAEETLACAIDLHMGQPWRWAMQLGDWRVELGDLDGALTAYRQALGWQPGESEIEERIARLLAGWLK